MNHRALQLKQATAHRAPAELPERCQVCDTRARTTTCGRCTRACNRKKRYPTFSAARVELERLRPEPWDDPTLHVYECHVASGHFHLGHASGDAASKLRKRAEKMRKRLLLTVLSYGKDPTSE